MAVAVPLSMTENSRLQTPAWHKCIWNSVKYTFSTAKYLLPL